MNRHLYERQVKSIYPNIEANELDRKWRRLLEELRDLEGTVPEENDDDPPSSVEDEITND